jgi:Ca2+/Na+ antiporter
MLNFLLGIGISCLYAIVKQGGESFELDVSHTVFISGIGICCGLLFSLLFLVLNGFRAGRVYGSILIVAYFVVMIVSLYFGYFR